MADLRELTQRYVTAFNAKDIEGISDLLADNFSLTDPTVSSLAPKAKVVEYIQSLFNASPSLSFEACEILVDKSHSAIHFILELDGKIFHGIDLVHWSQGKMLAMNAYLTQ